MSYAASEIKEIRFVIGDKLTHCYIAVDAIGDCPLGVQGWHYKVFPASKSVIDILGSTEFTDYLLWPQESPDKPPFRQ